MAGRIRNVTASGFKYIIQEQAENDDVQVFEIGAYIAWEPSSGTTGDLAYQVGMSEDTMAAVEKKTAIRGKWQFVVEFVLKLLIDGYPYLFVAPFAFTDEI